MRRLAFSSPSRSLSFSWACLLLGVLPLYACTTEEAIPAGQETGACVDGTCLQGLECLSDLCVAGDETEGTTADTSDSVNPSGTATTTTTTNGTSSTSPTGPSTMSTTLPTSPTTGPTEGSSTTDPTDGTTEGDPTTGPEGNCSAVDVLLVIDNSGSMGPKQARLAAAIPDFLDDLELATGSSDHHVMVVDTDAWVFGGCEATCGLLGSCPGAASYVCGETMALECEDILGAGVTFPRGDGAAEMDCDFAQDARYAVLSQPAARDRIECAAQVGTGSSAGTELPMEAMLAAVGAIGEAETCNAGFARDGVPLLVMFATDEEEGVEDSMVSPMTWHNQLIAARGGDASMVAVLGLIGDTGEPGALCQPLDGDPNGAENSPRLTAFIEAFDDLGVRGSICAANYGESFAELIGVLEGICSA